MTRKINLIVLHCSATPSGKPLQQGKPGTIGYQNCIQVINAWHAVRGFKREVEARRSFNSNLPSVGYHFVIDIDGTVYTGRGVEEVGAHVAGANAHSIGICMVGGMEREGSYTPKQWHSLAEVVRWQATENRIPLATAVANANGVCGHRDLSPDLNKDGKVTSNEWLKTCPGFDVSTWLSRGLVPLREHVLITDAAQ